MQADTVTVKSVENAFFKYIDFLYVLSLNIDLHSSAFIDPYLINDTLSGDVYTFQTRTGTKVNRHPVNVRLLAFQTGKKVFV